jgi:hypothetical protein
VFSFFVLLGNVGEQERIYVFYQRIGGEESPEIILLKDPEDKLNSKLEFGDPPASGQASDENRRETVKRRRHKRSNAGT